ncbi:MAG: hypothetical protein M1814_004617 [Vezdaea aestivalis]|nr:MAG: hypothetical protein M1814_004617 [Vezdaea aestivalis]
MAPRLKPLRPRTIISTSPSPRFISTTRPSKVVDNPIKGKSTFAKRTPPGPPEKDPELLGLLDNFIAPVYHQTPSKPQTQYSRTAFPRRDSALSRLTSTSSPSRENIETRPNELEMGANIEQISRSFNKVWDQGDVYSPQDLSPGQMFRNGKRVKPKFDRIDLLGVDPIAEYKNFALLGEFMTDGGAILGRRETGLRPVNQRKVAKAIRRAIGLGLLPSGYRHPEIIDIEHRRNSAKWAERYTN